MLTVNICDCKVARHVHGDNSMYVVHGCRCDTCREAKMDRERVTRRQQLYGRHWLTDAAPARKHIRGLMAAGMGWKRVARAAGVSPSSVYPILYGRGGDSPRPPRKQISKRLSSALLAVTLDVASGQSVDATGTRRRLQALVAIGWSQAKLAALLGMGELSVGQIVNGRRTQVTIGTARAVAEVYEAHWDRAPVAVTQHQLGAVSRAVNLAKRNGWAPAAAWDDIDDPDETPKHDITDPGVHHVTRAAIERAERLELLIQDGYGDDEHTYIRAGWSSASSARKALRTSGRGHLIDALIRNDRIRGAA